MQIEQESIYEELKDMTLEGMTKNGAILFYQRDIEKWTLERDSLVEYKEQLRSEGLQYFFSDFLGQGMKAKVVEEDTNWNFLIKSNCDCSMIIPVEVLITRLEQYIKRIGIDINFEDIHYENKTQCYYLTVKYKKGKEFKEATFEESKFLIVIYRVLDLVDFRGLFPVTRPSRIDEIKSVTFS